MTEEKNFGLRTSDFKLQKHESKINQRKIAGGNQISS